MFEIWVFSSVFIDFTNSDSMEKVPGFFFTFSSYYTFIYIYIYIYIAVR